MSDTINLRVGLDKLVRFDYCGDMDKEYFVRDWDGPKIYVGSYGAVAEYPTTGVMQQVFNTEDMVPLEDHELVKSAARVVDNYLGEGDLRYGVFVGATAMARVALLGEEHTELHGVFLNAVKSNIDNKAYLG